MGGTDGICACGVRYMGRFMGGGMTGIPDMNCMPRGLYMAAASGCIPSPAENMVLGRAAFGRDAARMRSACEPCRSPGVSFLKAY